MKKIILTLVFVSSCWAIVTAGIDITVHLPSWLAIFAVKPASSA